jgi:iron complex outermembrane receptor protein
MTKFYLSISRFLSVLLVLTSVLAWSQSRTVSGKVTSSDDGSGIPGANIQIKGTSTGTVTNSDGSFSISASDTDVLVFSFVGYATQEITVGTQSTINVSLQPDVTALSEVVVVGYGTVRVKDATGAVAAVGVADFNGGLISSAEQLIQGKTAGVQVVSTSGQPGAGVQLRIRGSNSIRSNNNPLFVVDGVPLAGGTQPASADVGLGSSQDTNPLNFINPNDIESMSILKDASAAAIYGSRGANGVVLITTKSGKGGKGKFALNSSVSISSPANKYDLLDREDYLQAVSDFGGTPVDAGSNTDWQDYMTRTSVSTTQNLSYNKGFATGAIRASFGYENLVGVMENSNMQRITGRVNGNRKFLDDKLNIELAGTYSNVNREDPAISGNAGFQGDILGAAYSANPTWPTDPDFNPGGQRSPANLLKYFQSTGTTNRFLASLSASYQLNSNFLAKALYGIDVAKADNVTLNSGKAINSGNGVFGNGQGQIAENKNLNNLVELTLNYTKTLGNINIDVVGGYSFQSFHNEWYWAAGRGFDDPDTFGGMESELNDSFDAMQDLASGFGGTVNNWGAANTLLGGGTSPGAFVSGFDSDGTRQEFSSVPSGVTIGAFAANFYDQTDYLQSYFGRGNFTIAQKYLITATVRVDGSSKFGPNNQYGVFPSGAVAWKIHEEEFMPDVFTTFKLRAGYGIVGNQDGLSYGQFIRRERWADVNLPGNGNIELGVPGTTTQGDVNPDLKWEETTTAGIGIDFGILEEKLTGTIDWYSKSTTDLLLRIETAQPAQQPTIFANFDAIVENVGWEISLTYSAIDNETAAFNISGNLSHNDNMVKDFAGALNAGQIYGQGLSGAYAQQLSGGHPLFSYHLREFEGFDSNGQPIGDNQTFIGKGALPIWNMGLSLSGRYKAFDFSMYFAGQYGHYIYNNTQNAFFTAGSIFNGRNVTRDVLGSGESGSAEAAVSTRFLHSGNFTRLQNLSVGYTVPKTGLSWLSELRFYVTGQNLFVITDYNGLDPEVSSNPANYSLLNGLPTAGIDYAAYPRPRTFTLGLKATF